jgi:uncharacterized membrane protein
MKNSQKENDFVVIQHQRIILILVTLASVLLILSLLGQLILFANPSESIEGLIAFFNVAGEVNLPTFYTTFLLLSAALLLLVIWIKSKSDKVPFSSMWAILTIGFVYLSLDEMLFLHERVSQFIRTTTNWSGTGILRSPWVIIGLLLSALFAVVSLRFYLSLDKKTRLIFLIAGITYVFATMGFEIIENIYDEKNGQDSVYRLMQHVEEGLEMAAIILFIFGLLRYMSATKTGLIFGLKPDLRSGA